jgi:hypothetical protein
MTNDQDPNPNEIPSTNDQLGIGIWDLIGVWDLDLGY